MYVEYTMRGPGRSFGLVQQGSSCTFSVRISDTGSTPE